MADIAQDPYAGFPPRTADKVERLLDCLAEMDRHPSLKGKLALHGGTAINIFMLDIPRLSVDIDVSYVGTVPKEDMLLERDAIEEGIAQVAQAQGYVVTKKPGGLAGTSFLLRYRSDWGQDSVKVDCIYLNRSPILPLARRQTPLRTGLQILSFADAELVAGKVKAFFDRVKIRDLYDLFNISRLLVDVDDAGRKACHKLALYYASLSAAFPFGFSGRSGRFAGLERAYIDELLPMLRSEASPPTLEELLATAEDFTQRWVLPQNDREQEYLVRFAQAEYAPELLFDDNMMAQAAAQSPEALWKLENLKKKAEQKAQSHPFQ